MSTKAASMLGNKRKGSHRTQSIADELQKIRECLGNHGKHKHSRQTSLRGGDSGEAKAKHHPGLALILVLLYVVTEGETGDDHTFRAHDKKYPQLGYTELSVGIDGATTGLYFSAEEAIGSSGDSGYLEPFTISGREPLYIDSDYRRNDTGLYGGPQTRAITSMADRFGMDANTNELLSSAHPDCESIEMTGLTDPRKISELKYLPADIAGTSYSYNVAPSSLFAAVYKLHFQESPCHDVFNLESEANNKWVLSAKHEDFGQAHLQPTDTPPFTIAPCQTVGVHGLIRQTEDGVVDFGDDGLLVAPTLEAVPVLIKLSKYNKYNQLCSTHGDYFKVEVVGPMKMKFKASFAVKQKLKSLCATSSESIESLLDSVASGTSTDRKTHNDAAKPQPLEEDETNGEAEGYELFYKNDCIKAEHAKTKSCTGETLIHIIVEAIISDEDSTSVATSAPEYVRPTPEPGSAAEDVPPPAPYSS